MGQLFLWMIFFGRLNPILFSCMLAKEPKNPFISFFLHQHKNTLLIYRILIISVSLLFLLVNTQHFWEAKLGGFTFPVITFLGLTFIAHCIVLTLQFFLGIKERFQDKSRNITIAVFILLLGLIYLKPRGLINFESLQGKDVLIANREGAANCMTTLKLKEDLTFKEKSVCFGTSETTGSYALKNDTIYFHNIQPTRNSSGFYKFALINRTEISLYESTNDSLPLKLFVTKNELQ